MYLTCPKCCAQHIDEGIFATRSHHTHSCQLCGLTWRPAIVPTVGVQFLPGFKNEVKEPSGQTVELLCQFWITLGLGDGRHHAGFTLHADRHSLIAFVNAHWDAMPKKFPQQYERCYGAPFWVKVSANSVLLKKGFFVASNKHGTRYSKEMPIPERIAGREEQDLLAGVES